MINRKHLNESYEKRWLEFLTTLQGESAAILWSELVGLNKSLKRNKIIITKNKLLIYINAKFWSQIKQRSNIELKKATTRRLQNKLIVNTSEKLKYGSRLLILTLYSNFGSNILALFEGNDNKIVYRQSKAEYRFCWCLKWFFTISQGKHHNLILSRNAIGQKTWTHVFDKITDFFSLI